jgi:hypothetical protein
MTSRRATGFEALIFEVYYKQCNLSLVILRDLYWCCIEKLEPMNCFVMLMISDKKVQECDATEASSSNSVWFIKIISTTGKKFIKQF